MKYLLWLIGLIIAWNWVKSKGGVSNAIESLHLAPSQTTPDNPNEPTTIQNPVITAIENELNNVNPIIDAYVGLSNKRKLELDIIAQNIYRSLRGVGANVKVFMSQMLMVNSDMEFDYLQQSFGVQRRKDLRQWIDKELLITKKVKSQINLEYSTRKMLTII